MLAPTRRLDSPTVLFAGVSSHFVLMMILVSLLAFTTLAQLFFVLPNHRLFIRVPELLFVGVFLATAGRSYEAPRLKPALAGWLFLAWLGASVAAVGFSAHLGPSLIRQAEWLMHILFAVTLWSYLRRSDDLPFKAMIGAIPAGFLLVGLYLLYVWFYVPAPRSFHWFTNVPLVGHVRHFGYYALAAVLCSAAPLVMSQTRLAWRHQAVTLVAMAACWGFLFWTGGRAAVGSGFVGIALLLAFATKGQRLRAVLITLGAVGIGLWLSTLFWVEDTRLGFFASIERTAVDTSASGVNGFTTGRLNIWGEALSYLQGHVWFGIGPDSYKTMPIEAHGGIQPHSFLIQFLLDWGILGALPFLGLLGLVFWHSVKRLWQDQQPLRRSARIVALTLIMASTLHSVVDGLYYYAQPLLFLFTCFAIALLPTTLPSDELATAPSPLRWLTTRTTLWIAWGVLALIFLANSDFVYTLF